jgi:uncharacterized integral membrane protein
MLRFGVFYVLVNIFALLVITLLAQNARPEHLTYFGITRSVNLAVILAGAAVFGFLVGLLLLMPGRIALSFHAWGLDREASELDEQVAELRVQREDLLDRFDDLVDGHERILRRYHQLVAEHREVVADRERLRAVVGKITAPIPVSERIADIDQNPPSGAGAPEKVSAPVATSVSAPGSVSAPVSVSVPAQVEKPSLVRLTRRLLPSAIW